MLVVEREHRGIGVDEREIAGAGRGDFLVDLVRPDQFECGMSLDLGGIRLDVPWWKRLSFRCPGNVGDIAILGGDEEVAVAAIHMLIFEGGEVAAW